MVPWAFVDVIVHTDVAQVLAGSPGSSTTRSSTGHCERRVATKGQKNSEPSDPHPEAERPEDRTTLSERPKKITLKSVTSVKSVKSVKS